MTETTFEPVTKPETPETWKEANSLAAEATTTTEDTSEPTSTTLPSNTFTPLTVNTDKPTSEDAATTSTKTT